MKKLRYTEEQIVFALRQAESGVPGSTLELSRNGGSSINARPSHSARS